jgi:hypothetical protein
MKKLFALAALTASLSVSAATHWVTIMDSENGNARLLVDAESWKPVKSDDGSTFIVAVFRYIKDGTPQPTFVFVTQPSTCHEGGGQLYHRELEKNEWVTKYKFWWSDTGSKMYDAGGMALCEIMKVRLEDKPDVPKTKPGTFKGTI